MPSPKRVTLLLALAVLLLTPGCAVIRVLVDYPTPTPVVQRPLRPTFTPTATRPPAPTEAVAQAAPAVEIEATPEPPPAAEAVAPLEVAATELPPTATPPPSEPPPPTATPTATPFVVVAGDVVRARSGPGTDYDLLGEFGSNEALILVARNDDGSWWQVCCLAEQVVWVFGELVDLQGSASEVAVAVDVPPPPPPTSTPEPRPLAVVQNARVNVRSGPGTEFPVVGQVSQGARLDIVGRNPAATWWEVCCVDGQPGWVIDSLVGTEGPVDSVALASSLPAATPGPIVAAVEAATVPVTEPGNFPFELTQTETFPYAGNDYFRVGLKVRDGDDRPLGNYYLRVRNETTGQEWLSRPAGERDWGYSAPNREFADFREVNLQFDTNGLSPLADQEFVVWLVDGGGQQVSPRIRYQQGDGEFQWLYVVLTQQ